MVTSREIWSIRQKGVDFDPVEVYGMGTTFFCMKIHHGGEFKGSPGRSYVGGTVDIVDQLDGEEFNVHELDKFVIELGYQLGRRCFYSFLKPKCDLDTGLMPLTCDQDIRDMIAYVKQHKQIEVYIEHGSSVLHTFSPFKVKPIIEEVIEVDETEQVVSSIIERQCKSTRRQLQLEWNANVDDNENEVEDSSDENEVEDRSDENESTGETDSEQEEDNDSDYHEEVHEVHDVEVDMRDFNLHIDPDVEWGGMQEEVHVMPSQQPTQEGDLNFDNFDSLSSSEENEAAGSSKKRKKKVRHPQFNRATDMRNVHFYLGQEFATKADIKDAVNQYSVETRRNITMMKNDNIRVRVACAGELPGSNEENNAADDQNTIQPGNGKGKRKKKRILCPWVLHLSRPKDGGTWQVKTLNDEHVCLQTRQVKACTAKYLAKELVEQVRSNPGIPVKSIREQFEQNLEVEVSSMKAFRAKTLAQTSVIGNYQQQYTLLRDYALEVQRTNPGTTFKIEVESCANAADPTRIFKRCYICLGPLKQGFNAGCRKVLFLDGTFMKGPYPGQLLTAVGIDPNNGIYPVAYGLVEAETFNSWKWFLECLGDDLEIYANTNFTFMTDRQKGLIPALANLFPCAEHRFCLRHIWSNFKLQFKGKEFKDYLWAAATTTTVEQYTRVMEDLCKRDKKAFDYLNAIGAHHWSRSHFTGIAKTDVLYNNICESLNKQLVDGRDKPVLTCLEFVREYLMQRIVNVQNVIKKSHGPLCPATQKIFESIKKQAASCKVIWNGSDRYQVTEPFNDKCVVDLGKRTCACRKWELSAMPCKHAVAAIWVHGKNGGNGVPENWVDTAYKLDTWKKIYKHKVNPINGPRMWPKSGCPSTLKPPLHRTPIGRPAKKRRKEPDEGRKDSSSQPMGEAQTGGKISRSTVTLRCTKCGNPGHNSRTCKGQGGATSNPPGRTKKKTSADRSSEGHDSRRQKLPVSKKKRAAEGGGQTSQASGGGQATQASGGGQAIQASGGEGVQSGSQAGKGSGPQYGLGSQQSRDPNVVLMRGLLFSTQPRLPKPTAEGKKGASSSQP